MRTLSLFVAFFWAQSVVAAATFVGETTATFRVTERIDGTTTTANKTAPLDVTLTTDYSTMRWSADLGADVLISGGPSQPFETRLLVSGTVASRRCAVLTCGLDGIGEPSPLSFPDANGRAGAGSYFLLGSAEWTLSDRIVTATRERHSPQKAIVGGGLVSSVTGQADARGNHYLSVIDYPEFIFLTHGLISDSSWQTPNGQWNSSFAPLNLGRISDGDNYLEVVITNLSRSGFGGAPEPILLREQLPGDFSTSGAVDAGDYVVWRESPGVLAPFLTSYDVWRSEYGNQQVSELGAVIPEPSSCTYGLITFLVVTVARKSKHYQSRH